MQKITTFLWYDGQAEEAVAFYTSLFKDSKIKETMPGPGGKPMCIEFQLAGQDFVAMNGGPQYKFTPATSLFIRCETQEEVDHYWGKLTADGGAPVQCGWLTDKYGLSWQVVPNILMKYMNDKDRVKANNVMQAMMQMVKLNIDEIEAAYQKA